MTLERLSLRTAYQAYSDLMNDRGETDTPAT